MHGATIKMFDMGLSKIGNLFTVNSGFYGQR
jgi:hypothetical protein